MLVVFDNARTIGFRRMTYSEAAARDAHCWFDVDRVSGDPETTGWKRRARLRQALWREARGYPMGAHPHSGGDSATPVGSRLSLAFAMESGANFVSAGALAAARARLARREPFEMLREDRLWADLLSSMPLCFNVFGDFAGDPDLAARAVRAWWPDAPEGRKNVSFEHSPGRRDPLFLGNQSAFDAAFEIELSADTSARAIIGIETKYHEHAAEEAPPKPLALARYTEVTERSGAFVSDWREKLVGTPLQQLWQDHLLVLSMLQHPRRTWIWGRFVLLYPAENVSFSRAAQAYRAALRDASTFEARTLEDLLAAPGAVAEATKASLNDRYFGS